MYDIVPYIAEYYDLSENYTDDVDLIRRLLGDVHPPLRILEPFTGTGRMLIPLAQDGHFVTGLDISPGMLKRAQDKIDALPREVQECIQLRQAEVVMEEWPRGFHLVVLGGNCFYELATPEQQERVVAQAAAALEPGGWVYIDNNHMEGELAPSWQQTGVLKGWPTGVCPDGTRLESTTETVWFDARQRLARFHRSTRAILPGGQVLEGSYEQQKHPVSTGEVRGWLEQHGFEILHLFGNRAGEPYTPESNRAIIWAQKR